MSIQEIDMAMGIDKQNQRNWMGESNPNTEQAKDAARYRAKREIDWKAAKSRSVKCDFDLEAVWKLSYDVAIDQAMKEAK